MAKKKTNHNKIINNDDKNRKNNSDSQEIVIEQVWLEDYFNIHTGQLHPVTKKFLEREAQALRDWALLDTSLRLSDFYDTRGYDTEAFYAWISKCPEFEKAHNFAKRRIASRREIGALTRKYSEAVVFKTLGYYDYVYSQEQEKAFRQRQELNQSMDAKVVVIERFPSTDGTTYEELEVVSLTSQDPEKIAHLTTMKTKNKGKLQVNTGYLKNYEGME